MHILSHISRLYTGCTGAGVLVKGVVAVGLFGVTVILIVQITSATHLANYYLSLVKFNKKSLVFGYFV